VKATVPTPPEPTPKSVTEVPDKRNVTVTKKGSTAANPALKSTKALRQVQMKNTEEKVKAGKSSTTIPNPTTPRPSPETPQSPIEEISDLLDTLHIDACVELTLRLLTAAPTLPPGVTRSRSVLKTVVHFVAKYGSAA
jgi:hypothetical protein